MVWMFIDDNDDEYKVYQKEFRPKSYGDKDSEEAIKLVTFLTLEI